MQIIIKLFWFFLVLVNLLLADAIIPDEGKSILYTSYKILEKIHTITFRNGTYFAQIDVTDIAILQNRYKNHINTRNQSEILIMGESIQIDSLKIKYIETKDPIRCHITLYYNDTKRQIFLPHTINLLIDQRLMHNIDPSSIMLEKKFQLYLELTKKSVTEPSMRKYYSESVNNSGNIDFIMNPLPVDYYERSENNYDNNNDNEENQLLENKTIATFTQEEVKYAASITTFGSGTEYSHDNNMSEATFPGSSLLFGPGMSRAERNE